MRRDGRRTAARSALRRTAERIRTTSGSSASRSRAEKPITSRASSAADWSHDGKWIAFEKLRHPPTKGRPATQARRVGGRRREEPYARPKRFDGRVITSVHYKRDGTLDLLPDPSIHRKLIALRRPGRWWLARQLQRDVRHGGRRVVCRRRGGPVSPADEHEDDNVSEREPSTAISRATRRRRTAQCDRDRRDHARPRSRRTVCGSRSFERPSRASSPIDGANLGPDGILRGQPQNSPPSWDDIPGAPTWTADGRAARFARGPGGNNHLFEAPLQGKVVRP